MNHRVRLPSSLGDDEDGLWEWSTQNILDVVLAFAGYSPATGIWPKVFLVVWSIFLDQSLLAQNPVSMSCRLAFVFIRSGGDEVMHQNLENDRGDGSDLSAGSVLDDDVVVFHDLISLAPSITSVMIFACDAQKSTAR